MPVGNPFAESKPVDASLAFEGLDDAQAFPPGLGAGRTVAQVEHVELYTDDHGNNLSVRVKVETSDNPENVVGKVYTFKIRYIFGHPRNSPGAKARLKSMLAAILGVDASSPPPADIAASWADLAAQVVGGEGDFLSGDRLLLVGTAGTSRGGFPFIGFEFKAAPEVA